MRILLDAPDRDRAINFYANVLGDTSPAAEWMVPAPAASAWRVYFDVEDLAGTCARVQELGGRIVRGPTPGQPFALCEDPTGASFGLAPAASDRAAGAPGLMSLVTRGAAEASAFYAALLGFEVEELEDPFDGSTGFLLTLDGEEIGSVMDASSISEPLPDEYLIGWQALFEVDDLLGALASVAQHGGRIVRHPSEWEYENQALVTDPAGACFALTARE